MRKRQRMAVLLAAAAAAAALPAAAEYRLDKVVAIPSGDSGWDYNSFDGQRGRLFVAHRKNGLHVYDTRTGKVIKDLPQSAGANTSALAPEFDLGIVGTTDGHIVVFRLSTLTTLRRYKSSTDGFDGAGYDAVSKRFAIVGEADEEHGTTQLLFFDGRTGAPDGELTLPSKKVDAPRPDGEGSMFLPLRDQGKVARVDMRNRQVAALFALDGCVRPAALEVDRAARRVFVGCRGDAATAPALAVLDGDSGHQVSLLPIGRGVDEVMYDGRSHTIVTANGDDASMTVIGQQGPDRYRAQAVVGTRPRARTGVLDEASGNIYLVTAQYVDRFVEDGTVQTQYVPNTFSVLTYGRR